ncbi:MAG: 50S ribosomal protein L18 [Patescibacteria group bacterium]
MNRATIHKRIRAKVKGTAVCPRLCVFRSNVHVYAQLIDDDAAVTLCAASDRDVSVKGKKHTKAELARLVGMEIAKRASKKGITRVVFDRGGFQYHGRVKQVAEGAREGKLSL